MMETMRRIRLAATALSVWMAMTSFAVAASGSWDQPVAALADKIVGILGPGQAHVTIRNLSTIPAPEIPLIRKLLEDDLRAHGLTSAGDESANAIRVTLSESAHERIWVAEIVEGSVTQVAMVELAANSPQHTPSAGGLMLRKQAILTVHEPVLAALEAGSGWVVLEPEQIAIYTRAPDGWHEFKKVDIGQKQTLPRDPRGLLTLDANGAGFHAWLAGAQCAGSSGDWAVSCNAGDDPWPIASAGSTTLSAFYNPSRNFFTGIVTPALNVELPRFYASAWMPRAAGGVGLLVGGIDGKVQLVENGALKSVAGTRDWGSDFVVLNSGCGAGSQIVASSSGVAATDSLRAYELPALEAVPTSAPLEVGGSVTALWAAPEEKSAIAIVRNAAGESEVDRVSALCN
jgi:hypothetical protein